MYVVENGNLFLTFGLASNNSLHNSDTVGGCATVMRIVNDVCTLC